MPEESGPQNSTLPALRLASPRSAARLPFLLAVCPTVSQLAAPAAGAADGHHPGP